MHILDVRSLTKQFGGVKAIEDISFRIQGGSIVSIIGPNGAGKTTLFNCLTGMTRPTKGQVQLSGNEICGLPAHSIVQLGIARTFQNIRLFKEMTVLENVLVAQHKTIKTGFISALARGSKFRSEEEKAENKALEYLALVGLEGLAGLRSANLPYGDQRRLEIARAFATEPHLILLDEPTAGMNPKETSEIMELIKKLKTLGKTVLLIEHDMRVVMGISEKIIVLDHGVKIAEGTPDEVKSDQLVIEAYLGREAFA